MHGPLSIKYAIKTLLCNTQYCWQWRAAQQYTKKAQSALLHLIILYTSWYDRCRPEDNLCLPTLTYLTFSTADGTCRTRHVWTPVNTRRSPYVAVQNVPASYLRTVAVTEVNAPNALYYVQAEQFREYHSTLCYGQANRAVNYDRRRGVSYVFWRPWRITTMAATDTNY